MLPDRPIPTVKNVRAGISAPPSKSATQRALIAAALASGRSRLRHPLLAGDPRSLVQGLNAVGIPVRQTGGEADPALEIEGCSGEIPARHAAIDAGNAGTTIRFLTAMLSLGHGDYLLDGDERMRRRPIEDLLEALRALGGRAEAVEGTGCPPVRVGGPGLAGGPVRVRGGTSSQYLSALLLAAPATPRGVDITLEGALLSRPYVDLTIDIMRRFGAEVETFPAGGSPSRFRVAGGRPYEARDLAIEGDYSSASYFFAAAAVTNGRVQVRRLDPASRQGDAGFLDLLSRMGCRVTPLADGVEVEGTAELQGIDADCGSMPDIVPTLAVVALFASGPTRITGVPHLKVKESDRIEALVTEIRRLGGVAEAAPDGLAITPGPLRGTRIETYADHRIAMAFAIAGLAVPGVVVSDPGCVIKSFPGFWDELDRLTAASS